MKNSGGGGSLLAADTKGFRLLLLRPMSLRAVAARVAIHMRMLREQNGLPRRAQGALLAKTPAVKRVLYGSVGSRSAFTMAEILLSLTIIGVVAAITLPSLTGNINERVWNTQRKALYARFSQALALMPSLNGYGSYVGSGSFSGGYVSVNVTTDTAAEAFVTEGLSKVLKINNICDNEHLSDCGIPTTITKMEGSTMAFPTRLSQLGGTQLTSKWNNGDPNQPAHPAQDLDTKAMAFETVNGESIAVFYNPWCQPNLHERSWYYAVTKMCANFIYDLNGAKGPNTMGKDIGFITALYANDPVVVAPMPLSTNAANPGSGVTYAEAQAACSNQDMDAKLPNIDELSAMAFNQLLIGFKGSYNSYAFQSTWSSTSYSTTQAWKQYFKDCGVTRQIKDKTQTGTVRCIKR